MGQSSVTLTYHLGRTQMRRSYELFYPYEELKDPNSLVAQLGTLVQEPAVQRAVVLDNSGLTEQELLDQLTGGSMTYVQTVYRDGGWSSTSYPFEEKVARAVLEAVLRDIDAGRAGGVMFTADGWEQTCQNSLEFWYTQEDGLNSMSIDITPAYTETIAALRQYGIINDERPLLTNGEIYTLSQQVAEQPIQQDNYEILDLLRQMPSDTEASGKTETAVEANP